MAKAVRHDREILRQCQVIWVKEYWGTRWGVGGEAGKQFGVSVSYSCVTNHAKWSGLNNKYL